MSARAARPAVLHSVVWHRRRAFAMRGPKTFTGEDVIEITTHNNPFIIESVMCQKNEFGGYIVNKTACKN